MPGTYEIGKEIISIREISTKLEIFNSKMKPRKTLWIGNDGIERNYMIKSKENVKQDERAMQLFSIVNAMVAANPANLPKNLSIQRYPVIPLFSGIRNPAGLIGFLVHSDNIFDVVSQYRKSVASKLIHNNTETAIKDNYLHNTPLIKSLRVSYDFPHMSSSTLLQKVAIYMHIQNTAPGNDIAKHIRLKCATSDSWLERRINFTRSLAVMNMVGYILGLGDRHVNNIFLNAKSGKITHIDLGDCFEYCRNRDDYPEHMQFRLTRMFVKTMEITGINGIYRDTCINVMQCLRENATTISALLDAFMHDPLINWEETNRQQRKNPEINKIAPNEDPEVTNEIQSVLSLNTNTITRSFRPQTQPQPTPSMIQRSASKPRNFVENSSTLAANSLTPSNLVPPSTIHPTTTTATNLQQPSSIHSTATTASNLPLPLSDNEEEMVEQDFVKVGRMKSSRVRFQDPSGIKIGRQDEYGRQSRNMDGNSGDFTPRSLAKTNYAELNSFYNCVANGNLKTALRGHSYIFCLEE